MKQEYFGNVVWSASQRLRVQKGKKGKEKNILSETGKAARNCAGEGWKGEGGVVVADVLFRRGRKYRSVEENARATCGKMRWIKGSSLTEAFI